MPLYDYYCKKCGLFSALRKMADSALSEKCHQCGEESERVISAPYFAYLSKSLRLAHERSEKSAHEPGIISRSACGCSGQRHSCNSSGTNSGMPALIDKTVDKGFRMQTKKTARPWMLGH
jgi:putative FmdB family regulatory protein